jgi:hypothetical protein
MMAWPSVRAPGNLGKASAALQRNYTDLSLFSFPRCALYLLLFLLLFRYYGYVLVNRKLVLATPQ